MNDEVEPFVVANGVRVALPANVREVQIVEHAEALRIGLHDDGSLWISHKTGHNIFVWLVIG